MNLLRVNYSCWIISIEEWIIIDTENYPENPTVPDDGNNEDDGEHGCPHHRGHRPWVRHRTSTTTKLKCDSDQTCYNSTYTEVLQVMLYSRLEVIVTFLILRYVYFYNFSFNS